MAMYVMCSRARSELFLAYYDIDPNHPLPASISLLPSPDRALNRYLGLGSFENQEGTILNQVEWAEPLVTAEPNT
jgi:hypothetical protein